jgi:A118 family predicted phage portal protein
MDVFDVIDRYGKSKGRDFTRARLKGSYDQYVNDWKAYYRGNVDGINTDTGFNGEESYPIKRRSMRLAKMISEKWATSLFSEAFKVTLKDDTETEKFRKLEKQTDFRAKINKAAIYGYGMGTAALLASADIETDQNTKTVTGGKVKLDMIKYDSLFPLVYDNNDIEAIAFIRQEQKKDTTVYTIGIHSLENGQAVVENITATVKGENVEFSATETVTQSKAYKNQLYAIIKPNTANDYTDLLPFGQSIFADSLAPCEQIDLAADLLRRDVEEGGQVTFVGRDLLMEKVGKNGNKKKLWENTKGKFFVIPQKLNEQGKDIKQLFEKSVPEIRTMQLWQVIKDALTWACMTSGLGKGSLDIVPMATATQVVTTESERMANKSLHEQYLECEIIKLVKGLCELSGMIGNPIDASEITITWEDSVIETTAEQKRLSLAEIDNGVISKIEYRMKYYGETEQEAAAKIKVMEQQGTTDNFDFLRETE